MIEKKEDMRKADEAALKAYPVLKVRSTYACFSVDANEEKRNAYWRGYKQAEKDLALTWEDMKLMNECLTAEIQGILPDVEGVYPDRSYCKEEVERFYKHVLSRFNEAKNKL